MGSVDSKAAALKIMREHPVQGKRASERRYDADDHDGYKSMRVGGDAKGYALNGNLFGAVQQSLADDGKVDLKEVQELILPRLKEGPLGKDQLMCNERWTIRFCLGEFRFDEAARRFIFDSMWDMKEVYDSKGKLLDDEDERHKTITGPDLAELGHASTKRARVAEDKVEVDGMLLSRPMLLACKSALSDDGVVDAAEAVQIFLAAAADGKLDQTERWTLRFLISAHSFTDAAFHFIIEALSRVTKE